LVPAKFRYAPRMADALLGQVAIARRLRDQHEQATCLRLGLLLWQTSAVCGQAVLRSGLGGYVRYDNAALEIYGALPEDLLGVANRAGQLMRRLGRILLGCQEHARYVFC